MHRRKALCSFPFPCVTGGGRKDEPTRKSSVGCFERKCVAHVAVGSRGHTPASDNDGYTRGVWARAPILLSTSSSFWPSFDATCASNAWLRCASGSRASRTSITTSALSSTAARSGRSGLRSSGALLTSVVEAGAEEDIPFVAGMRLVDLDGLFVGPASVATPSKSPSSPSAPSLS